MAKQEAVETAAPAETTETLSPDLTDYPAWEKAELSGEPSTPAVDAEKPETSEPAVDAEIKPAETEKVEAQPEPEAGKPKEQKTEPETKIEHGPGWWRRQVKRELVPLREEVASLREQLAAKKTPEPAAAQPVAETAEPKEEDFETTPEFTRALTVFHAEQIAERKVAAFKQEVATRLEDQAQEDQRQSREATQAKQDEKWAKDVDEARKNHADFDEVVFSPSNIPTFMDRYTRLGSEDSGELAYYLASKPDEVKRIAALPQVQQIREFVKIEAQFSVKEEPAPKQNTQVTTPLKPKPTTPIGAGNSAASIPKIDDPAVVVDYPAWERMERERLRSK